MLPENLRKIGLFRRPGERGSLELIPLMIDTQKNLMDIVENTITFTEKSSEDFRYTISDESKVYVNDIVEKCKSILAEQLKEMAEDFLNFYLKAEKRNLNWTLLYIIFQGGQKTLLEIQKKLASLDNTNEIAAMIMENLQKQEIPISESFLNTLLNNIELLNFLDLVTNDANINMSELVYVFNPVNVDFRNIDKWYQFIENLSDNLLDYEIQIKAGHHRDEIDDILELVQLQDIKALPKLEIFLVEMIGIPIEELSGLMEAFNKKYKENRLKQLYFILTLILKHELPANCLENKINSKTFPISRLNQSSEYTITTDNEFILPIITIISVHQIFADFQSNEELRLQSLEEYTFDIDILYSECEHKYDSLLKLRNSISSAINLYDVVNRMNGYSMELKLPIPYLQDKYTDISKYIVSWTNTIDEEKNHYEDSLNWYKLLDKLYTKLKSDFDQISDKYSNEIKDFGCRLDKQELEFEDYISFLNDIGLELSNLDNLMEIGKEKLKIHHLKNVRYMGSSNITPKSPFIFVDLNLGFIIERKPLLLTTEPSP